MSSVLRVAQLSIYFLSTMLLACSQGAPSKSFIEELVMKELRDDQGYFDISNLVIVKDYWDGDHNYIAEVNYTRTATKSYADLLTDVAQESKNLSRLEKKQLALLVSMLKLQYGKYKLGDSFEIEEKHEFSLSRDGWVYKQRIQ